MRHEQTNPANLVAIFVHGVLSTSVRLVRKTNNCTMIIHDIVSQRSIRFSFKIRNSAPAEYSYSVKHAWHCDNVIRVVIRWPTSTATLQAYNPVTNAWDDTLPDMPTVRPGAAATVLNNVLYVVGGFSSNNYVGTLESFDPTTRKWTSALPTMPTSRTALGAAALGGKLFAIGGCSCDNCGCLQNIVQAYDPGLGKWSTTKFPKMPTHRLHNAIAASGPLIVTAGGMLPDGITLLSSVSMFDLTVSCQPHWATPSVRSPSLESRLRF